MNPKISTEEKYAILQNLVAHKFLSENFSIVNRGYNFKVTERGLKLYASILDMTGQQKILNGPKKTKPDIMYLASDSMRHKAIDLGFIEYEPLDKMYSLTRRGVEHISVLFNPKMKGHTDIATKINRLFRFGLKG